MQGKGKANDRNNGANQDNCDWAPRSVVILHSKIMYPAFHEVDHLGQISEFGNTSETHLIFYRQMHEFKLESEYVLPR